MPPVSRAVHYLCAAAVLAGLGALLFAWSGMDDRYITYWAARSLARLGRIVNYNGDPIEQSSTLGYTVILAAAQRLSGASMVAVGTVAALAFGALTVVLTGLTARRLAPALEIPALYAVATSPQVLFWSFSGMEMTAAAAALLLMVLAFHRALTERPARAWSWAAAAAATIAWTALRPEAPLVAGAALAGAALVWRAAARRGVATGIPRSRVLAAGAVWLGASALVTGFRLAAFGRWLPAPVSAKLSGPASGLRGGVAYLFGIGDRLGAVEFRGALAAVVALALIAGGVIVWRLVRRAEGEQAPLVLPAMLVGAQVGFIAVSGGDWMPGGRFFAAIVPLATVLALRLLPQARRLVGVVAVCLLNIVGGVSLLGRGPALPLAFAQPPCAGTCRTLEWSERRNAFGRRDGSFAPRLAAAVGEAAARRGGERVTVLSGQAGASAYYLALAEGGRFRFYDRHGLTTVELARCPLSSGRRGPFGLDLPLRAYLERMDEFRLRCGIPRPDVIYDRLEGDATLPAALTAHGYRVSLNVAEVGDYFLAVSDGDAPAAATRP